MPNMFTNELPMNRKCGHSVTTDDRRTLTKVLGADKDKALRDQTLGTTTDSMFDCKSSDSDQSEDKRNCHIYLTSILSITLVMFSPIQSTFSAVFSYLSDLCHSLLCLCYVRMLCRNVCVVSNNVMSDECEFFQKVTFSFGGFSFIRYKTL